MISKKRRTLPIGAAASLALIVACATLAPQRPPLPRSPRPAGWDKRRPDEGSRYAPLLDKAAASAARPQSYQPFDFEAKVVGRHAEKRALYLRVKLSKPLRGLDGVRVKIRSRTHGVAALAADKDDQLLVRFVEPPPRGEKLAIAVHARRQGREDTGGFPALVALKGEARLAGLDSAPKEEALAISFFRAAAKRWGRSRWHGRADALSAFARGRFSLWARELANEKGVAPWRGSRLTPRRNRRNHLGEMMALYTGMTSIEEALQTDRGLLLRRDYRQGERFSLASIKGVELPAHPWEKMIAELNAKSVVDPMAQYVPAEMAYLYAHDLRTLVRVKRELSGRFTELFQALEGRGGDSSFMRGYEQQLAIRSSALSEALGHLATDGVALISSDPLQREGSDMTLLFLVRNESLLRGRLKKYAEEARARRPDATTRELEIAGNRVELLSTPDGDLQRYLMRLGPLLVASNSKKVLKRLLAVQQKKIKSLAESGDYRYMRARYRFTKDGEDAFLFIGDDFVAHVTSPRFKILQARRMEARADLQAVGFSALVYGWLQGKAPRSIDELRSAGHLLPQERQHADGAKISYSPRRGAHSAWGRAYRLTPLIELSLEQVSKAEAESYARFRDSYQRYWRGYIDPIAIRIRAPRSGQLELDGRMLPLIEGSGYDELLKMVGQTLMRAPDLKSGALFTFAVGQDARLRRKVDSIASRTLGSKEIRIGWLGDWVSVGASDRGGLYDLALVLSRAPIPGMKRRAGLFGLAAALVNAPLFAEAHVANALGLVAVLSALRTKLSETAAGMVSWTKGESYRGQAVTELQLRMGSELSGGLYYAVVKDVFTLSLNRATLEERIDAHLDGDAHRKFVQPMQSTLRLHPWKKKSWLPRLLLLGATKFAFEAEARALEAVAMLEACHQRWARGSAAARQRALAHLGWVPGSVFGGTLSVDQEGIVSDSKWGNFYLQLPWAAQKKAMESSPLSRVLGSLEDLQLGLAFEGKGAHRGLHVRSRLFYKKLQ